MRPASPDAGCAPFVVFFTYAIPSAPPGRRFFMILLLRVLYACLRLYVTRGAIVAER